MNATTNIMSSILLSENLSFLPLLDVYRNLNAGSMFLNSFFSDKWEALVRKDGMKMKSAWEVNITETEVSIQLEFENSEDGEFEDGEYQNFGICFKLESDSDSESKMMAEDVRLYQENDMATIYCKTSQYLEKCCLKALPLLNFLFPPSSYNRMSLSLGSKSPDFPFHFISQFPRRKVPCVSLHADQDVDGADLVAFLRKFKVVDGCIPVVNLNANLYINARIKNPVMINKITTERCIVKISDARFLTPLFLKKLNLYSTELGQNNFSSKDFNQFLGAWMGRDCHPSKASFDIREDQEIKMEEVMAGFTTHVGTPRMRDRWMIDGIYGANPDPKATDFANGWDITNADGTLGTVLLEANRLIFVTWSIRFQWHRYLENVEHSIRIHTHTIESLDSRREFIQRSGAAGGKLEMFPDELQFLENYPEAMRIEQGRLAVAYEVKEKLLKEWMNDETVNEPAPPKPRRINRSRTIVIFGSADIALNGIPLALQFSRGRYGRGREYVKFGGNVGLTILLITDVDSMGVFDLDPMTEIIYAYSDAESFQHLTTQFPFLDEKYQFFFKRPIRQVNSMLLHFSGSEDRDEPDQSAVESFQRDTWSNLFEFRPNSPIDSTVEYFIQQLVRDLGIFD